MPPPRTFDLLPLELQAWFEQSLVARGFGDYESLAEELNSKLEAEGMELRISKSALGRKGKEYRRFVEIRRQAHDWTAGFFEDEGLGDEIKRHKVLFEMLSTLAFEKMRDMEGAETKELLDLGKMLRELMASSGIREKIKADEEERIRAEEREAAAKTAESSAREAGLSDERAAELREKILGVKGQKK